MKRFITIISTTLIICLLPLSMVKAQEKKSEQKIKIIIDDGSGTKVIVDTVITDMMIKDSLKLKDGKVIFIGHTGNEEAMEHSGNKEHVTVMVTTDGKEGGEHKTITWTDAEGGGKGEKVIIVKDGNIIEKDGVATYKNTVHSDKKLESNSERTKYIISKDGMVITVEGDDYDKVKALVNEIEKKLEVK